jgi:hypothetical protein
VDAGVDGRGAGGLVRAGGVRRAGGELAAGDGGVQGDDVLGVDGPAARAAAMTSPGSSRSPPGRGVLAVMTASAPPGRHPLARRVQHAADPARRAR